MTLRTLFLMLLCAGNAFAQSADQEVVSVVDSPDPVVPGQNITYTVTMRNNGPNAAVGGGLNVNLGGGLTYVSNSSPAGFSCATFGAAVSCTTASFASGTTAIISLVVHVEDGLISFPDGSITSNFSTSGVTIDPNSGNNNQSATTAWDSPQFDLSMAVTDTPDPVGPDQNITYSMQVTHAGPDTATNVNVNAFNNGSLRFQSLSAPAGFTCTPLAVGAVPTLTCSKPALTPGTYNFSLVVRADDEVLGINDGTVATAFNVNGVGNDVNQNNNSETESTAYVTPDADMAIAVGDTPDPAVLGEPFEYLITITNHGPDAAPGARMNMFNSGTLRFVLVEAPAGYTCTPLAVGATPTLTCQTTSLASGASAEIIVTVRTDAALTGPLGGTFSTAFTSGSTISDPANANNAETENTQVIPVLLFANGFE
jgi:uncharacterized repeat protein (TIGR01451 family)